MKERPTKQLASFPLGAEVFLFDVLGCHSSLFLYEREVEIHGTLFSFVETGLNNGEICLFAYDNAEGKLHPEQVFHKHAEAGKFHLLPMGGRSTREEVKELGRKFRELCRRVGPGKDEALRVAVDFGDLPTRSTIGDIIDLVGEIYKKRSKRIRGGGGDFSAPSGNRVQRRLLAEGYGQGIDEIPR